MVMPNTILPKINSVSTRPYTFDILSIVVCALNDPEQHAIFTKDLYDRISKRFRVLKFVEMPKCISITVEKDESTSHLDVEEYIQRQFGHSVLNCFSELLDNNIPKFGSISTKEAMIYIVNSFPMLNMSTEEGEFVYHIGFVI